MICKKKTIKNKWKRNEKEQKLYVLEERYLKHTNSVVARARASRMLA